MAAAANLKLDNLLLVIVIGMLVAIPAAVVGNVFANNYASKFAPVSDNSNVGKTYEEELKRYGKLPSGTKAFSPIIIPILLMALGSIAKFPGNPFGAGLVQKICVFAGTPVNALLIGVIFAFMLVPKLNEETLNGWIGVALKDAAIILIITAAGGAFGSVIKEVKIGDYLGQSLKTLNIGIFVPFIIAAALKTAQGSSTVALVTTSALLFPLLPSLGFTTEIAKVLVVMAIGAGSMTVSHANDSYFWVVSQFGGMDVKTAYRSQTVATLLQGIVTILTVYVLSLFLI